MSTIDFNNLNYLVRRETLKVIRETLDAQLGDESEEQRRQKRMADTIKKRGLKASDNASDVDEAEVEEEAEEEVEEEVEEPETGVPTPDGGKDAPREDRTKGKGTADSKKLDTPTEKQLQKATVGSVIDKLNALRGGRSLKDPEVKKSFKQYFDSLTHKERETLLVYLTGMAQILAGVASGEEALDPGDVGLRVKGTPDRTEQSKDTHLKRAKEKNTKKSTRPGTESAPIIVGESQNKRAIMRALKAYRQYK